MLLCRTPAHSWVVCLMRPAAWHVTRSALRMIGLIWVSETRIVTPVSAQGYSELNLSDQEMARTGILHMTDSPLDIA